MRLEQGDCLELLKSLPDGCVDMVLCDPPYGTTACKWDTVIPFEPMWAELHRVTKPDAAICLFGSEPFSSALRISNLKYYRYDWVWEKPQGVNPLLAKKQPLNNIELISVFYKRAPTYNPQFEKGEPYHVVRDKKSRLCEVNGHTFSQTETNNNGYRYPKRVLRFARQTGLHPTQKPVDLLEYLVKTYTNEGETVLDFTMGSGSSGVACINTGREFIGFELSAEYYRIARQRVADAVDELLGVCV